MSGLEFCNVTLDISRGRKLVRVLSAADFRFPARQMCLVSESRLGTVAVLDLICRRLMPQAGQIRFPDNMSWPIGHAAPFSVAVTGMQAISHLSTLYALDRDLVIDFIRSDFDAPDLLVRPVQSWPRPLQTQFMLLMALVPGFDFYLIDGNLLLTEDVAFSRRFLPMFLARTAGKPMLITARQSRVVQMICDCAVVVGDGGLRLTEDLTAALAYNNRMPTLSDPIRDEPEPVEDDPLF